jgi:cytochrome c oxidase assembly factor CtaG
VTTAEFLGSAWQPAPVAASVGLAALTFYGWRFRGRLTPRALSFGAAVTLFWLAQASPVAALAHGYLFSAHMLQHLILLLAVPTLALIGLPRETAGHVPSRPATAPPASRRNLSLGPWLAGVGAMWLWHERSLCDAAAIRPAVEGLQVASLLSAGLVFWWPLLRPRLCRRLDPFPAVLYLFSACLACSVLGILITFSPIEVCNSYAHPVDRIGVLPLLRRGWGLSASVDQEVGGLMMWVPTCLVYLSAILAVLARHYLEEGSARLTAAAGQALAGLNDQ